VFFRVSLPGGGTELWKSDGTTSGTVRVAALPDTMPPATGFFSDGDWRRGAGLGDLFLFAAGGANTVVGELWRSDGTEAGTLRVADTGAGPTGPRNSDPRWFARYGDRVYFNAYDPQWGRELWSTDGTATNTALFEDIYSGVGSSDPAWLEVSGGTLWFSATDDAVGNELRKVTIDFSTNSRVTERQLFYNNSVFDQHDDNAISDFAAVAPDKQALLPGEGPAGFENLSSYSVGINGMVVGFFSPRQIRPHDLGPDDFEFRMGTEGDPATWPLAPSPTSIRVIPLPGPNSYYALSWPDRAIRNTWLRCTIKANEHTNLAAPDVFHFGNLVGETGDGDARTRATPRVTALDLANVRRALNTDASRTSPVDINRDGRVNSLDLAAVRSNYNQHLPLLMPPPPPPAPTRPTTPATAVLRDNGEIV
jgi:ELWxxDGT repeat protein